MVYLLSYPRSGRNLLSQMLGACGLEICMKHELDIYSDLPLGPEDFLILLVRDYKECLANHNFRRAIIDNPRLVIDERRIDQMFGPKFQKEYRAMQYVENLVLFDMIESKLSRRKFGMLEHRKALIYYEDLIDGKYSIIAEILHRLPVDTKDSFRKLAELDWDKEARKAKLNYDGVILSERAGPKYHVNRIQDPQYLRDRIYNLNPKIYNKYLKIYDTNDTQR